MALTDDLFAAAEPLWRDQLDHPFVQGLGDGSLDEKRFKRWVLQDYLYLKEFARVFAWAVAKADRLESMSWYAGVLNLTLNTEMALHRGYAARGHATQFIGRSGSYRAYGPSGAPWQSCEPHRLGAP